MRLLDTEGAAKAVIQPTIAQKGKNQTPKCWTKNLPASGKARARDWKHRGSRVDMPPVQPRLALWLTLHCHGHQEVQPGPWTGKVLLPLVTGVTCCPVAPLPCVHVCPTQPPPALLLTSHQLQGGLWEPSPQGFSFIASLLGGSGKKLSVHSRK